MADVAFAAGEVVVEADNLLARLHQAIDQVGANEAGAARDQVADNRIWNGVR